MSRARASEPEGAPVALGADELRSCGALEDENYQTAVAAQTDPDFSVLTLVPGEGDLAGMKVGLVPVARARTTPTLWRSPRRPWRAGGEQAKPSRTDLSRARQR